MAQTVLGSVFADSLRESGQELHDNVFTDNPLMAYLKEKGRVRSYDGGYEVVERMQYARNPSVGWRDGKKSVPVSEYEFLLQVAFRSAQITGGIAISRKDEISNKHKVADWVTDMKTNTEETLKELVGRSIYSDGTDTSIGWVTSGGTDPSSTHLTPTDYQLTEGASDQTATHAPSAWASGDQIYDPLLAYSADSLGVSSGERTWVGLEGIISASNLYGSGVFPAYTAPLDRSLSQFTWWRSNVLSTSEALSLNGGTDKGIWAGINYARKFKAKVDLVVTSYGAFDWYNNLVLQQERIPIANKEMASLGFDTLYLKNGAYMMADWYCPIDYDSSANELVRLYEIDTTKINIRPYVENVDSFTMRERVPVGTAWEDIILIYWDGLMTCTRPQVMTKITNKSLS